MDYKILDTLHKLLKILAQNTNVVFQNKNLLNHSVKKISTPVGNMLPLLLEYKSTLSNHFVSLDLVDQLVSGLTHDQSIVRLNHIGFCYKVNSQDNEKERLIRLINKTNFHLYQEKSNDDGLWLFIGDIRNWEAPLIELLPVEKTTDTRAAYWLPHIQIDIDTRLTADEIKNRIKKVFGNAIQPYSIIIDGIVYIVRSHLGTFDGVNIKLDLATNARNVKFMREELLHRID